MKALCAYCLGECPAARTFCSKECKWCHDAYKGALLEIDADLLVQMKETVVAPGPWFERAIVRALDRRGAPP